MPLIDSHGRNIDYLRISITDRCNLRCFYCTPFCSHNRLPRGGILTYEEILRVAKAAVTAGITKIRITGGEPLVRRKVVEFCRRMSAMDGLEDLALTTNGILLNDLAQPLYEAGVHRLNVSLDTLRRDRFVQITGKDCLPQVLEGLEHAEQAGFVPIKINAVVMRGINEDEIEPLAALTFHKPYHVRFIELMPFGDGRCDEFFMPVSEMIRKIPNIHQAQLDGTSLRTGPARLCRLPGAAGRIGFIAPLSWHFCGSCNRLRLTADGKLRTCLFSDHEIDIRGPLRTGASKQELVDIITAAVAAKPERHSISLSDHQFCNTRRMYAIGG
jgi:GTP 3',8-cyclase